MDDFSWTNSGLESTASKACPTWPLRSLPPQRPVPAAPATVDTSGLERLISSRLDMVEDVLRMVEHRLEEGVPAVSESSDDDVEARRRRGRREASAGDRIITASGEVVEVGGTARMMEDDQGRSWNSTRRKPWLQTRSLLRRSSGSGNGQSSTGAPTVAALLLDHMSGMAAVSFTQKAMESGMLTQDEGDAVLAMCNLLNPAIPETALGRPPAASTVVGVLGTGILMAATPICEVKSEMSGSVGVGGLIIGISMLVIFSMAYQAISLQIESGVDRIEDADEPLPAFTIDGAVPHRRHR